jgi:hypothetical protein
MRTKRCDRTAFLTVQNGAHIKRSATRCALEAGHHEGKGGSPHLFGRGKDRLLMTEKDLQAGVEKTAALVDWVPTRFEAVRRGLLVVVEGLQGKPGWAWRVECGGILEEGNVEGFPGPEAAQEAAIDAADALLQHGSVVVRGTGAVP